MGAVSSPIVYVGGHYGAGTLIIAAAGPSARHLLYQRIFSFEEHGYRRRQRLDLDQR